MLEMTVRNGFQLERRSRHINPLQFTAEIRIRYRSGKSGELHKINGERHWESAEKILNSLSTTSEGLKSQTSPGSMPQDPFSTYTSHAACMESPCQYPAVIRNGKVEPSFVKTSSYATVGYCA